MVGGRGAVARVLMLCAVGALLGPTGGCGVGGGRRIGLPEGGALRPGRLAYALAPEAATVVPGLDAIDVPPSVDLRREGIVPPIQNQVFNSCVGWSLGYYVMSGVLAREMRGYGKYLDMSKCENWFSPEFLYSQRDTAPGRQQAVEQRRAAGDPMRGLARERDNDVAFMRPEEALLALFKNGICPWSWLSTTEGDPAFRGCASSEESPDGPAPDLASARSRAPWQYATIMAKSFRPRCYVRFGDLDDLAGGTARRLRAWLADQGTPIAVVLQMSGGWVRYRGGTELDVEFRDACGVARTERRSVCLNALGDPMSGAHMLTLIGYDRNFPASAATADVSEDLRGSFLFANQWGEKWGDKGYMWIPATELHKVWIAGYGIVGDDGSESDFGNPVTSQKPICFQDETGKYIEISRDGNDVPANLLTVAERCALQCLRTEESIDGFEEGDTTLIQVPPSAPALCAGCSSATPDEGDVPEVTVVNTACRITWRGANRVLERSGSIGAQPTGESYDSADWFYFDVPGADVEGGSIPVRAVLSVGTGTCPPYELKITDGAYAEITVPDGAPGCSVVTRVGAGRHFVKIGQPVPGGDASGLAYTLRLEVGSPQPGLPAAKPIPYAERCVDLGAPPERATSGTLLGASGAPSDALDLYWVDDIPQGVEFILSVELSSAGEGMPDVQLFAMVNQGRIEKVESRRLESGQGTLRIGLTASQGDGDLTIGLRNLSSAAATYTLRVQSCGKHAGDIDPDSFKLAAISGTEPGEQRQVHVRDGEWFLLKGWDETSHYKSEYRAIDVTGFCRAPTVLFSTTLYETWIDGMACGDPLPVDFDQQETVLDTPWVHASRCRYPSSGGDRRFGLFFCPPGGGSPEPLRRYSARTFMEATLAAWPVIDDIEVETAAPRDGNDTPSQAETWVLSEATPSHAIPYTGIGESGGLILPSTQSRQIDLYDFYRIVNDTDGPRDVTITLTPDNQVPTGQTILLEAWLIDPQTNLATSALSYSVPLTAPPKSDVISLPAQGAALVMIRTPSGRPYAGYGLAADLK